MIKMTRTFTRTREMMDKYVEMMQQRKASGIDVNPFKDWKDHAIKEFNHWFIIPNDYPYDAIASVNHMIAPKREVAFNWQLLSDEEEDELDLLKATYLNEHYDVVYENLPKGQTIPAHFHLHLLVLKREEL